jgi:molybdenum cofactor cytidylyltransferase
MKSGRFPLKDCVGAVSMHRVRAGGLTLQKGALITRAHLAALKKAGVTTLLAARLGRTDLAEAAAALAVGKLFASPAIRAEAPVRGRVNLKARRAGLLQVDEPALLRLNLVHEGLAVSVLAGPSPVKEGQLVGTIKIIPFALPKTALQKAKRVAKKAPLAVVPFRYRDAVLVLTEREDTRKLTPKTVGAVRGRLEHLGARLKTTMTLPHREGEVAAALKALKPGANTVLLVMGASATSDRNDVLPKAIVKAGGRIERLGIPVDPGNLLFTGRLGRAPVIGLPGCARSLALNGFDWVLERMLAGIKMNAKDFARLGFGGLLKDIPERPSPRAEAIARAKRMSVAGIILASGLSRRFGANKLLAGLDGVPVIAKTFSTLKAPGLDPILVVTGFEADKIKAALAREKITWVENPGYAEGMAAAIRAGISALPKRTDAALIALGDMPLVKPSSVSALLAALSPGSGKRIAIPAWRGKRGNPVLWHRDFFEALIRLEGETGGKSVYQAHPDAVVEVAVDDPGILADLDTRAALDEAAKRA